MKQKTSRQQKITDKHLRHQTESLISLCRVLQRRHLKPLLHNNKQEMFVSRLPPTFKMFPIDGSRLGMSHQDSGNKMPPVLSGAPHNIFVVLTGHIPLQNKLYTKRLKKT